MLEIKGNTLYFDGCDTVELAEQYGTPLYVFSETEIRRRIGEFKEFFSGRYPRYRIAYAAKAFCTRWMMRLCNDEGISVDVVSGGELFTALSAGFPAGRIEFNGSNKTREELKMAIEAGVGRIIADSLEELDLLEEICRGKNRKTDVLIRINPSICADTHEYIMTGAKNSKFGVAPDEMFFRKAEELLKSEFLRFKGLHMHLGSQILQKEPFSEGASLLADISCSLKERTGADVEEINLGGGFGAVYTCEKRQPVSYYLQEAVDIIAERFEACGMPLPVIAIEPGRSIVAEAGITLYQVGNIKTVEGGPEYVSVDGGMSDNLRVALYNASYDGVVCNKAGELRTRTVTICGKCCESGDILIRNIPVAAGVERGDVFAVFSTGAYGYSMACNYNRNLIPAVVSVCGGKSSIAVRRQTYEDLLKADL